VDFIFIGQEQVNVTARRLTGLLIGGNEMSVELEKRILLLEHRLAVTEKRLDLTNKKLEIIKTAIDNILAGLSSQRQTAERLRAAQEIIASDFYGELEQ